MPLDPHALGCRGLGPLGLGPGVWSVGFRAWGSLATALEWLLCWEGHGDLERGLMMGIKRVTIWVIEAYLLSPHDPPSKFQVPKYGGLRCFRPNLFGT